ncbi:MAG TPA: hypothetical protein DC006_00735 [Prevotellaceae bacterium]|nr:hypothetical protein [Prevotellaceae bacterium]HBE55183.1 hypothetical protein [Prevotellaceae bacterium]
MANFVISCGVALAYSIAFLLVFNAYDNVLRRQSCAPRKRIRQVMTLWGVHSLLLLLLVCWLPEYMSYIIPAAFSLVPAEYRIACADKDTDGSSGGSVG